MFTSLYPLVQASPIALLLATEGDKLRVTITQKETKKGKPLSLCVTATPDELDAELAQAIIAEAGAELDVSGVADQVRAQMDAGKVKASAPAKNGSAEKAPNSKAAAASDSKPKPPTKTERKEACLADFVRINGAHIQKHGKPISREQYIQDATASTGREFERLFGNWTKFKAAGERAAEKAAAAARDNPAANVDDKTLPLPLDQSDASATAATTPAAVESAGEDDTKSSDAGDEPVATSTAAAARIPDWPFPKPPKDVERGEDKDDTSHVRDVYDEAGNYLSAITTHHDVGDVIHLQSGAREVTSTNGRRIFTKAFEPPPWTVELLDGTTLFKATPARPPEFAQVLEHAGIDYTVVEVLEDSNRCTVRRKVRDVVLEDGTVVAQDHRDVEPGEAIVVSHVEHTVLRADSTQIVVLAPPPPPKVRNVIDDDGGKVGTYSTHDPLTEGEEITVDGRQFTVMGFTEKAVFVEPADVAEGA